ncbi:TolB protein [Desulfonatronum thiosulfatophilum]|uniref:TolB protein n=1 Tax=Desulfonatronum thiosulfatophilum TaxID=617002 RepID=A0A1G6DQA9_9BACT|nr:PD40 domain-containing protein [Desulfonatronum thiosulfatophilum]SDB47280.1 TolB protein [Desulfonatronum thiosulfatophilum]
MSLKHKPNLRWSIRIISFFLCVWGFVPVAWAQQTLSIDIYGPGQSQLNLVAATPLGIPSGQPVPPKAAILADHLREYLSFMPFLRLVPGSQVLGGDVLEGVSAADIDFRRFRLERVDLVLTSGWTSGGDSVELRVYETFEQRLVLGKAYSGVTQEELPQVAARFCADLMAELTGQGDFFRSTLAFVRAHGENKEIWAASPMGQGLRQLTQLGGISMSPSWSRNGQHLTFTLIADGRHYLAILDKSDGNVRRVQLPGNSVISPVFNHDGKIFVSLNPEGRPDIYQLTDDMRMGPRVAQSWAIDISPSFDATGSKMAFVSSRLGNPHIFIMDTASGDTRRVTFEGTYNTNPSLSPDGRMVVFSRQTSEGHRIFLHDLVSGRERQLTFGPRNDVSPAWAPDNFFIAFSSDRSGESKIYLTTRHGDEARMAPLGDGQLSSPAWSRQP